MYRYPETIKFKKSDLGNYKQQNLVSKVLGKEYDAHDASADVKSLYELLSKLDFSEKDIFPINITLLSQSFTPLIKGSYISRPVARRLAQSGLSRKHLMLAFNRGGEDGVKSVLSEHDFTARTAKSILNSFTKEE